MNKNLGRKVERRSMVFVTIVLCLAFFTLHKNYQKNFEQINANYKNRTAINLDKNFEPQLLANILVERDYVSDDTSAIFIANHIKNKLKEGKILNNLGELNKKNFRITASLADSLGGKHLKTRVAKSCKQLETFDPLPAITKNISDFKLGNCDIKVKVIELDSTANFLQTILGEDYRSIPHTIVQLKEHYYVSSIAHDSIIGYTITNEEGIAFFKGLKADGYYSVLPIRRGFEYGKSKGTSKGNLGSMKENDRTFIFTQNVHKISPFDTDSYSKLKEDNILTVRTPQEYKNNLITSFAFILLLWWILHIYLCVRKKMNDQLLLPLIMTLSGICLLIMYSIGNPINDRMYGTDMAQGIIIGIIAIFIISEINLVTLFNSNYKFLGKWDEIRPIHFDIIRIWIIKFSGIFGKKIKKWASKMPEGSGYLIISLVITTLLFPFGTGPEGSDVKVNLFFFQPGEIVKYLIIIFLAAFFYYNADKIQVFSETFTKSGFRIQFRTVFSTILGLGLLLIIYLKLGDMGPALVIAITFIIIYSMVRKDLPQLTVGVISFMLFLLAAKWYAPDSQWAMFVFALIWLAVWLIYGFVIHKQKQLFESAIFFNIVIAAFIFGSNLPNVGERLQDRNEIYTNIWDNEVRGGDQVAQGLWSLASGGTFGQGLGKGNPNLVPAFHTDMIFTSIGEEMGWLGLLLIVLCLSILLHRSLLVGQRGGHPFIFYLAAGIAIITGVQFLIITLGSVGIIPLTGVNVPFLSYGKVSMIMNIAAFGVVFSISNLRATNNQKEHLKKYNFMIDNCRYFYAAIAIVLMGALSYYQFFHRNETLIRYASGCNVQGKRILEYNPRIQLLIKNLDAGNIYDRNGLLLATNDKEQISNTLYSYIDAGVDEYIYRNELKKFKHRYYPFGENLIFWIGDYNQQSILWSDNENDPRGYIAEYRHLADLRGFNDAKYDKKGNAEKFIVTAGKYKAPFLYSIEKRDTFINKDYSELLPMLKAGVNSNKVERFNRKREKRDITLTVDAKLQTRMQNEIAAYVAENFKNESWNKMRISVVVLDAANGDCLCSANYPLPDMETLKKKQYEYVYNEKNLKEKAYTDRDLGLTYQTPPGSTAKVMSALAGLQKLGTKAADITYYIDAREVVESDLEPRDHYITMEEAIRLSSNNYFINLVNDQKLYTNLDSIYQSVGIRIDKPYTEIVNGKIKTLTKALTPYFFTPDLNPEKKAEYSKEVRTVGNKAIRQYENYIEKRKTEPQYFERMNWFDCGWAWGQGSMNSTPLNIARVTSIVANDGILIETSFIKQGNKTLKTPEPQTTNIVSSAEASILRTYMQNESNKHRQKGYDFPAGMGGKTGTPERDLHYQITNKRGEKVTKIIRSNDAWYTFFIYSPKEDAPLAVAVRMERLKTGMSGNAVRLTDQVVLKVLNDLGYLEGNTN